MKERADASTPVSAGAELGRASQPGAAASVAAPGLTAAGLSKSFGATQALRAFSFDFAPGRAYALVGENGSGKSTFVKLLCGVLAADAGELTIGGRRVSRFSPRHAMSIGVATCHQEILVEDNLSTLVNLFLWDQGWLRSRIRAAERRVRGAEMLAELSLNPPPLDLRVEHLSLAARQLLVIARTMLQKASVLLFDEVTAALDQSDAERVLDAMRRRSEAGSTVLFTTHRMEELHRLGDEVIVLRNGAIAGVLTSAELTAASVLKLMSGRTIAVDARGEMHPETPGLEPAEDAPGGPLQAAAAVETGVADDAMAAVETGVVDAGETGVVDAGKIMPLRATGSGAEDASESQRASATGQPGEVAMRVRRVLLAGAAEPVEVEVRWGEVTGLAGLDGHGQAELLRTMAGDLHSGQGSVEVARQSSGFVRITGKREAVSLGVTYLPRDRKTQGIFPTLSVLENFGLPTAASRTRLGFVSRRQTIEDYDPLAQELAIKTASRDASISSLSGGNQQKVLLARWLAAKPRVVLLDDPTRGVDIGTKLDLYKLLRGLAVEGRAVVVLSTEIEELATVCDRVLVLHNAAISADLHRVGDAPVERHEILDAMVGKWQAAA